MFVGSPLLHHRLTRIVPHIVDTLFLLSGVSMFVLLSLNPFREPWLVAKFVGLVAYIVFGVFALRRGSTKSTRAIAFVAAIAIFGYIVGVGLSRSPASWIALV